MLDAEACYAALQCRDPRFDGRFFVGVRSTGVYCRPVCPARTPRREVVEFFRSAAEAHAAGFRACLRCRPETAPHGPAWMGTEATVRRALRLIEAGALDGGTVQGLAGRLGIGDRHLRSLFRRHLGASPSALGLARRLRIARLLLRGTDLSIAEVADQSGFGSVRRFNDAIKRAFGRPPSALRRQDGQATLTVRIPYRPPLDFDGLLDYLAARAIPGVERIDRDRWAHGVRGPAGAEVVVVHHEPARSALVLTAPASLGTALPACVTGVRRLFDVDADIERVRHHLAPLALPPGLRLPGAFDPFETSVRIVLGQQVSVKGATTLAQRLVELLGPPATERSLVPFPEAERLVDAPVQRIGLPERRAGAIRALARAVADRTIDFAGDQPLDERIRTLCALPGIGPWTAHLVAMRAYGEPDAFPEGDLVLARRLRFLPDDITDTWRPWRAYAAMALWREAALETP